MKAFISGESGVALISHPKPQLRSVGGAASVPWHPLDALRVFDGCLDVRTVDVQTVEELDRQVELAWALDRALRLFLFLIDPTEPKEELQEYAECVGELVNDYPIIVGLKHRLAAFPVPALFDVNRVEHACFATNNVRDLVQWLVSAQTYIARVQEAFDAVPITAFGSQEEKRKLRLELAEEGRFFDFVTEFSKGNDLRFLRLSVTSQHRLFVEALSQWFDALQSSARKLSKAEIRGQTEEPAEDYRNSYADARQPNHVVFRSVLDKQREIISKIKHRDLDQASLLMSNLVAEQRYDSTPEQVSKSLSSMAQQAKRHDVPSLALEWSREATQANPVDPVAFGHLANAQIEIGAYAEAEEALNNVEQTGDPLFAATGRARIMRAQGRVRDARDAFIVASHNFEGAPSVVHALLGAAEALRELGDARGALEEYRRLSIFYPGEASVWAGLASTLVDLGLVDEALQTYSKVATYDSLIARTGRAYAYRTIGKLNEALLIYDDVLFDYPSNHFALCGRGDVLHDLGKLDLALFAYEQAAERSPYRAEPILGQANVLRHIGRFGESLRLCEEGEGRFPSDRRFAFAIVATYWSQGRFAEALIKLDRLIAEFPFDFYGRVARARILGRLGAEDEAMQAYESILAERPNQFRAILGKVALLIRMGNYGAAAALLPNQHPKARSEWRMIALKAFLIESREGSRSAANMLTHLIPACPYATERRRMRDLLATIELRRRRWGEARRLVEKNPGGVSNLISFHVFAATHRTGKARQLLDHIRSNAAPADVLNLAEEIARRHQLSTEVAKCPDGWIEVAERNILLAETA